MTPPARRVRVVITAGGTREAIDDVRALTNSSTGRLGAALARAAIREGCEVVLIAARSMLDVPGLIPTGVEVVPFMTSTELDDALARAAGRPTDAVFMAAAVADYQPAAVAGKIRSDADHLVLHLQRAPKLLDGLRARFGPDARLIGFKLLSGVTDDALVRAARSQIERAGLDATVANDAARLRAHAHPALWVTRDAATPVDGPREAVAVEVIRQALGAHLHTPRGDDERPGPSLGRASRWLSLPNDTRITDTSTLLCSIDAAPRIAAQLRVDADEPVVVDAGGGDGTMLGLSAHDLALWRHGWALVRAVLPSPLAPLVAQGRLVGAVHTGPRDRALWLSGELDPALWAADLLPRLAGTWRVPDDQVDRLLPLGWLPRSTRVDAGWTALTAPWQRRGPLAARPAASILLCEAGRVLVGRRLRGPAGWSVPGGRAEPGEDAWTTARRELEEETGIPASTIEPFPHTRSLKTWVGADPCWEITTFVVPVIDLPPPRTTEEFEPVWLHADDAWRRPLLPGARRALRVARLTGR